MTKHGITPRPVPRDTHPEHVLARRIFMDEDRLVRSLVSYHWMYKMYSAYENADLLSMIQMLKQAPECLLFYM